MRTAEAGGDRLGGVGWRVATLAVLVVCALWPGLRPASPGAPVAAATAPATEWPRRWNGRTLRPVALSAVEARFAAGFPGRIVRLTDGEQTVVWREVQAPTRLLHPAPDCYRALGFDIADTRLERDAHHLLWRCFVAERDGERLKVCERIVDASGASFTDTSSWFWAAQMGRSTGPWQAITLATPM